MPVKKGTNGVSAVYKGTTEIAKIYKGTTLVYQNRLLPEGYAECEYLAGTGTQWLQTNNKLGTGKRVELEYMFDAFNTGADNYTIIFGTRRNSPFTSLGANRNKYLETSVNSTWYSPASGGFLYQTNTRYKVEFDINTNYSVTCNGATITTGTTTAYTDADYFTIFRRLYVPGAEGVFKGKIYSFKLYNNNVLELNLIPCLDTHGVPCMYDTVSKTTLYNQGTDQFLFKIKKDIIPDNYTRCEYLESSGTQRFDTGIACNNPYKWEYDLMQLTAGTANTCVNGAIEQVGTNTYSRFHNVNNASNQWKFYVGLNDTQSTYTNVGANVRQRISVDATSSPASVKIKSQTDSLAFGSYANVTSLNFWLFGRNSNVEAYKFFTTERIYSFNVSNAQGKLVMQLVPCLDASFRPCMYDSVSKQTFYNQGTSEFSFKVSSSVLPDNYTSLSYLESTGTQYLNLGFKPSTGISAKGRLTAPNPAGVQCALGSMTSTSNRFDLFTFGNSGGPVFGLGYVQFNYLQPYTLGQTYDLYAGIENGNQWLDVDGSRMYTGTVTGNISSNYNMLLFARYQYGNLNSIYKGKIYYVDLYQQGVVSMVLVPCLDNNGVPCMYDLVTKTPFYNAGSGTFNYG